MDLYVPLDMLGSSFTFTYLLDLLLPVGSSGTSWTLRDILLRSSGTSWTFRCLLTFRYPLELTRTHGIEMDSCIDYIHGNELDPWYRHVIGTDS